MYSAVNLVVENREQDVNIIDYSLETTNFGS